MVTIRFSPSLIRFLPYVGTMYGDRCDEFMTMVGCMCACVCVCVCVCVYVCMRVYMYVCQ